MESGAKQRGFTLVEVLIVIVIMGIVATIGTPVLMNYLPNKNLRGTTRDIYSAAMQAKSEAIRRGMPVALQINPNDNQIFNMFVDRNRNGVLDDGDTQMLAGYRMPSRVAFNGTVISAGAERGGTTCAPALIFSSRGLPITPTGAQGPCRAVLCTTRGTGELQGNNCRTIAISAAGRVRTALGNVAN